MMFAVTHCILAIIGVYAGIYHQIGAMIRFCLFFIVFLVILSKKNILFLNYNMITRKEIKE